MPILQISPPSLSRFLQEYPDAILVDVREPWEHDVASLPDSKLFPLGTLARDAEDALPDPSTPLVVYCHHGIRSLQGCGILHSLGYQQLFNLAGGIDRYSSEVDESIPRY